MERRGVGVKWREMLSPVAIVAGLVLGVTSALLVRLGNPGNMGLCMACFERDIAGALGLHQAAPVQYLRPEILGIVLGAALAALVGREFTARSGSSPAIRLVLGAFVMIGALVFLGCPTRMVLRLGGGDGNALLGLAGFALGIYVGTLFLRGGASLGKSYKGPAWAAWAMPLLALGGVLLVVAKPSFVLFSSRPPGSLHAHWAVSLGAGAVVGVLGHRSRLCFAGGIRDMILFRSAHLLSGFAAVFAGVLVMNIVLGQFHPGFAKQPAAHTAHIWNLMAMLLVGLGSVLLGGCPFRQLILAAQGNGDSAVTVLGMIMGAALAHNLGLAASGKGVPPAGMIAVVLGLVVSVAVGLSSREKRIGNLS
ncbi:YedE family putative selenium transporter [Verrucomicrobiota bacterium]